MRSGIYYSILEPERYFAVVECSHLLCYFHCTFYENLFNCFIIWIFLLMDICFRLLLSHVVAASMVVHLGSYLWAVIMKLSVVLVLYCLAILKLILVMLMPLKEFLKVLLCSVYLFHLIISLLYHDRFLKFMIWIFSMNCRKRRTHSCIYFRTYPRWSWGKLFESAYLMSLVTSWLNWDAKEVAIYPYLSLICLVN